MLVAACATLVLALHGPLGAGWALAVAAPPLARFCCSACGRSPLAPDGVSSLRLWLVLLGGSPMQLGEKVRLGYAFGASLLVVAGGRSAASVLGDVRG